MKHRQEGKIVVILLRRYCETFANVSRKSRRWFEGASESQLGRRAGAGKCQCCQTRAYVEVSTMLAFDNLETFFGLVWLAKEMRKGVLRELPNFAHREISLSVLPRCLHLDIERMVKAC